MTIMCRLNNHENPEVGEGECSHRPGGYSLDAPRSEHKIKVALHLSGKRVSLTTPTVQGVLFVFFLRTNIPFPRRTNRVSVAAWFHVCHLTSSGRSASSIRCCPPNISSVTIDHDELCELPVGSGRLINQTVTLRTITRSRHSRTGITAFPLHLSTTTELV